jgi:hypothetical protein
VNYQYIIGSLPKYGKYDVVICSGILYHLDQPDNLEFIKNIYDVCTDFTIFDTHFSLSEDIEVSYKNISYLGRKFKEHSLGDSQKTKDSRLWSSKDNTESFWLTRPSLYLALYHCGFTSVYECHVPSFWNWYDRSTFVAVKASSTEKLNIKLPCRDLRKTLSPAYQTMIRTKKDLSTLRVKELEDLEE